MGEEQRKAPRAVREMMVRYRGPNQTSWRLTALQDFSSLGVRVITEEALTIGTPLAVQLGLPLFPQPVEIPGKIVWQRSVMSTDTQLTEYGIAFMSVTAEVKTTIDRAVERFGRHSP